MVVALRQVEVLQEVGLKDHQRDVIGKLADSATPGPCPIELTS